MRTVELLLDPATDASVRGLWDGLHRAGFPSLATHRHPTNRPHVTLVAGDSIADVPDLPLPIPLLLGPARMLGRALVREVVPTPELVEMQRRVWHSVEAPNPFHAPESWVPHVSLALNVPEKHRAAALARMAGLPEATGQLILARSYDSESRLTTPL